jgi:SWIM zinc finger
MNNEETKRWESGRLLAATSHIRKVQDIPKVQCQWKVQSQSDKTKYYTVIEKPNGDLECDCPDYLHRGVICKHIFGCIIMEVKVV